MSELLTLDNTINNIVDRHFSLEIESYNRANAILDELNTYFYDLPMILELGRYPAPKELVLDCGKSAAVLENKSLVFSIGRACDNLKLLSVRMYLKLSDFCGPIVVIINVDGEGVSSIRFPYKEKPMMYIDKEYIPYSVPKFIEFLTQKLKNKFE